MNDLRTRLQSAPPAVLFVVLAVLWGVGTWGLGFLSGSSSFTLGSLVGRAIGAVLFGGVMTAFFVWRRSRAGGIQTASAINLAIKTGTLPAEADAHAWLPLLRARERSLLLARWLNPLVFALFTALGVFLVVAVPRSAIVGWLWIVLFIVFAVFSTVTANRQLPKVRALVNQLNGE